MSEEQERDDTTEQEPGVEPDPDLDSFEGKAAPYVEWRKRHEKRSNTTQQGESGNE